MTFTTRLTNVRYRREHVDERTGMCYHQTPPSERVVMHVRDAGQAKPRLEHHPLSLLGACYATPRRKLNDPGRSQGLLTKNSGCATSIWQQRTASYATRSGGVYSSVMAIVKPSPRVARNWASRPWRRSRRLPSRLLSSPGTVSLSPRSETASIDA